MAKNLAVGCKLARAQESTRKRAAYLWRASIRCYYPNAFPETPTGSLRRDHCSLVVFMKILLPLLLALSLFGANLHAAEATAAAVYELRIYYTHPGKMPDLLKRFREHTTALFERHGMVNVGYWLPAGETDPDKLYYVLKHASRDAAKKSWDNFRSDPEWKEVQKNSEAAGPIVAKVDSIYLTPTDFSALK